MIVIAAYWIFLFFLFLPAGLALQHVLKVKSQSLPLVQFLGMMLYTVAFTVTSFFFPLNEFALLFWSIVSVLLSIFFKKDIAVILSTSVASYKALPFFIKSAFAVLSCAALLKSAQVPFITDNETYYIQTIKWLNNYGLVKGIGNLHLFFAQNSPWHILQAGVNFSFLKFTFNDLNGFTFILAIAYIFREVQESMATKKITWLCIIPFFSILFFQFIDSPSPDLPLLIIFPISLHLYLQKEDESLWRISFLLFVWLAFIKITIAPLGLLYITGFSQKKRAFFMVLTCICIAAVWMIKNSIASGYPCYPFTFAATGAKWQIPQHILEFSDAVSNVHVYKSGGNDPLLKKCLHWLLQGGITGIFNKLAVLLFIVIPFMKPVFSNKKMALVYTAFALHFMLLLITSPQYRFFLPQIFVFLSIAASYIFSRFQTSTPYRYATAFAVLAALFVFIPAGFSGFTKNKLHQANGKVAWHQLYHAEPGTKFPEMAYKKEVLGNLKYYSPKDAPLIYITGNGPLLCVNTAQIKYFIKHTGYYPQLLGIDISEGFVSKKLLGKP